MQFVPAACAATAVGPALCQVGDGPDDTQIVGLPERSYPRSTGLLNQVHALRVNDERPRLSVPQNRKIGLVRFLD